MFKYEQVELHHCATNDDNAYRLVPLQDSLLTGVFQHYPVQLSTTGRNSNSNSNNRTAGAAVWIPTVTVNSEYFMKSQVLVN